MSVKSENIQSSLQNQEIRSNALVDNLKSLYLLLSQTKETQKRFSIFKQFLASIIQNELAPLKEQLTAKAARLVWLMQKDEEFSGFRAVEDIVSEVLLLVENSDLVQTPVEIFQHIEEKYFEVEQRNRDGLEISEEEYGEELTALGCEVVTKWKNSDALTARSSSSPNEARMLRLLILHGDAFSNEEKFWLIQASVTSNPSAIFYHNIFSHLLTSDQVEFLIDHIQDKKYWLRAQIMDELLPKVADEWLENTIKDLFANKAFETINLLLINHNARLLSIKGVNELLVQAVENNLHFGTVAWGHNFHNLFLQAVSTVENQKEWTFACVKEMLSVNPLMNEPTNLYANLGFESLMDMLTDEEMFNLVSVFFERLPEIDKSLAALNLVDYSISRGISWEKIIELIKQISSLGCKISNNIFLQLQRNDNQDGFVYEVSKRSNWMKVQTLEVPPRLVAILTFSSTASGAHNLVDNQVKKIYADSTQQRFDSPYEAFLGALSVLTTDSLDQELFNQVEFDSLRETEVGAIEVMAAAISYQLLHALDLSHCTNLVEAMRYIFGEMSGLREMFGTLIEKISSKNQRQLCYANVLAVAQQGISFEKILTKNTVELLSNVQTKSELLAVIKLLKLLRLVLELEPDTQKLITLLHSLQERNSVTIPGMSGYLEKKSQKSFEKLFGTKMTNDMSLSMSELDEKLGKQLGLYLLAAARYRVSEYADELLKLLGDAVLAEAQGSFSKLKFEPTNYYQESQFNDITEAEQAAFKVDHSLLHVQAKEQRFSDDEIAQEKRNVKKRFFDQVIQNGHFLAAFNTTVERLRTTRADEITAIKKVLTQPQLPKKDQIKENLPIVLVSFLDLITESKDASQLVRVAKFLQNDFGQQLGDVKNDLQALAQGLDDKNYQAKESDELFFVTTTGSLRILIDIGDMVLNSGSCQSLTSGGIPDTTLGTALDAHTKAVVSFKISPHMLHKKKEIAQEMIEKIQAGAVIYQFNHKTLQLSLSFLNQQTPAGNQAHLDDVVIEFESGLMRELYRLVPTAYGARRVQYPSYGQLRPGLVEAMKATKSLIAIPELEHGKSVTVPGSKSPAGVWDDRTWKEEKYGSYQLQYLALK